MQLTEDTFRALTRSSPWRFRSLHFTRRSDQTGSLEGWLERPGRLRVRYADGREQVEEGVPYGGGVRIKLLDDGTSRSEQLPDPSPVPPTPVFRADGLVRTRPFTPWDWADPMVENYHFVSMLDPVELASGTELADLVETVRDGRSTWWATVRPLEGYEPRCGCCSLLRSRAVDLVEWESRPERVPPAADYPRAYVVGLDVATGVVVSLGPVGGRLERHGVEITVHASA